MYEYTVIDKDTRNEFCIYGYTWNDALRRSGLSEDVLILVRRDYID